VTGGDQYVEVIVENPIDHDKRQQELLEEFAGRAGGEDQLAISRLL